MKRMVMITILALLSMTVLSAATTVRADETLLWSGVILSSGETEPVFSPVLEAGRLYRILVLEMFFYDAPKILRADAQYYTTDGSNSWQPGNTFPAPGGHSFVQINGIDVHWGPFSDWKTGHTYAIYYMGTGSPILFTIVDWVDGDRNNNSCHLRVRIYELPRCAGAPRTIGFWKNHPDAWPVNSLTVGGRTYANDQALQILRDANAKDATSMLAAQLIAAKLNVLSGTWCGASSTVFDTYAMNEADTFLVAHPIGSNPKGADRTYGLMLKGVLDSFNNSS